MRIKNLFLALMALPLFFVACDKGNDTVDTPKDATVTITAGSFTESEISFTIASTNAEKVAYIVIEAAEEAPMASEVLANGVVIDANKSVDCTKGELKAETTYTIIAVAQNSKGVDKKSIEMTTLQGTVTPDPDPTPETFVATNIITDYSNEDGMHVYIFELGDNTWGNNGWGVDGGTYYSFAIITSTKGNGVLPNGTYTLADTYTVNTIVPDKAFRYQMKDGVPANGFEMYKDANVIISDGKIEANIELERDGSIHHVVFEGSLSVADGGSQAPVEFEATHTADKWLWAGAGSYGNEYMVSGENFSVDVHFQPQYATEEAIVAGEYIWTNTSWWGYNDFADFTTRILEVDGKTIAVDRGILVVSNEGEEYHIELTLHGRDNDVTYMIEYNGKINDKGETDGDENNEFVITSIAEGVIYNGLDYITKYVVNGENFSFNLLLNSDTAQATAIAAGDYMYTTSKSYLNNPGLFNIENLTIGGASYKAADSSTLNVATEDNKNFEITLNINTNTGDTFVVTYSGIIGEENNEGGNEGGSTEPAEPVKLATPSVFGNVEGNTVVISWQEIDGAKDYTVTLEGVETKTVTNAYITYSNLAWDTTYNVSVVANSSNEALYITSDAGTTSFSTGAQPEDDGNDDGGSTGPVASYEDWVFSATLDMGARLVTCTDGSHTLTFTLSEIAGTTFSINDGSLRAYDVTVNGVPAESASGTISMKSEDSYHIVLDAYINGVHYTGTSTNPVV